MTVDTGFFRGSGGAVLELPLPLSENYEQQRIRGQLTRVTKTGEPWIIAVTAEDPEPDGDGPVQPAQSATKNEWVGFAVAVDPELTHDAADAMTKADLIEKYGTK